MLSDWNWRTPVADVQNLEREQVRLQEELVMKEKALRGTQIGGVHENGRNEESSRDTETHITDTRIARECELHERSQRISRNRIEL